jgi:uncharacterized protein involved in exopolysaccharide biosynthesis
MKGESGAHGPSEGPSSEAIELESSLDSKLTRVPAPEGAALLVLAGDSAGQCYPIDRLDRVIGRAQNADIKIDEPAISQRHAKIFVVDGRHHLLDLGSTNGTYLNDEMVQGDVVLHSGDVIRIGETSLSYVVRSSDGAPPPTLVLRDRAGYRIQHGDPVFIAQGRRAEPFYGVQPIASEAASLRDLISKSLTAYRFARRHKRLLVVGAFLGGLLGGALVFAMPPAAAASFEVRLTPKSVPNPVQNMERSNIEFFASAESSFKSPTLISTTLSGLGQDKPSESLLEDTAKRLKLDSTGHLTYRGTFEDPSPTYALQFLERHVTVYLDTQIEKTLQVIRSQVDFLMGQVKQNEAELGRIESELSTFKKEHLAGLPEQAQDQFSALIALKSRQTALVAELERARLELDLVRSRVKSDDSTMQRRVQSTQTYRDSVVEVNRKLGEARGRGLGEQHPEVVALKRQAQELEGLNRSALSADVSDMERRTDQTRQANRDRVAEIQVVKTAAGKELGQVRGDIAEIERVVKKMPEVEARHAELARSYEATKELHTKLFQQLKASEVQLELERASSAARYEIISPPRVQRPSLRKAIVLRAAIGMVVGICLAVLGAGIVEMRRYAIRANL